LETRKELTTIRTELTSTRTELTATRTELTSTRAELTQTYDSQLRTEKDLSDMRKSLAQPEVLDLNDINTTMVSTPQTTDSNGNKRSNLAIMTENNDSVKRVKKEKIETQRQLEDVQDEAKCTICLTEPKNVLLSPCNHLLCCVECADKVSSCPVCRLAITNCTTAFL